MVTLKLPIELIALRMPEPVYARSRFCFRTSIAKRKGVRWILEANADMRNEKRSVVEEEEEEAEGEETETIVSTFSC